MLTRRMPIFHTLWFFILVSCCLACGPTISIDPSFHDAPPRKLAFLPVVEERPIEPRKISTIKDALKVELESKGFLFISDSIVNSICPERDCLKKQTLFSQYDTDALLTLQLLDVSRNSFGIGYTNSIHGVVTLANTQGATLVKADHKESERGGLLFDSGQIVRGLREQFESGGDTYFKNLARGFAREIAQGFPAPPKENASSSDSVTIGEVTISPFGFGFQKICANGTPKKEGTITFGRVRSTLRESAKGAYCAIVSIPANVHTATVSLKTPWGSSAQRQVKVPPIVRCDIKEQLEAVVQSSGSSVTLSCASLKNARSTNCKKPIACTDYSLHIYRTKSLPAPFVELKKSGTTSWIDTIPLENDTRYFGLLVDDRGFALPAFSIPLPNLKETSS